MNIKIKLLTAAIVFSLIFCLYPSNELNKIDGILYSVKVSNGLYHIEIDKKGDRYFFEVIDELMAEDIAKALDKLIEVEYLESPIHRGKQTNYHVISWRRL